MKKYLCIGSSISNLIASSQLAQHSEVHLIEIHAEVGMPTSQPGFVNDMELLSPYLDEEQLKFLRPHANEPGWGLRSEWLTKHLAMNAAQQGVIIHTKTRITSILPKGDQFVVEFQGGGPTPRSNLTFDHIIDASMCVPEAPGNLHHTIDPKLEIYTALKDSTLWFGGTALTTDCAELGTDVWTFNRAEGLAEVWFEGEPTWEPKHGWIEQVRSNLSSNPTQRTIDAQVLIGLQISEAFA